MVCDQMIGNASTSPLIEPKPRTSEERPLFALPVDTIHIHEVGQLAEAIGGVEKAGVVSQRQNDAFLAEGVADGFPIEVHGAEGTIASRNKNATNSVPEIFACRLIFLDLAIDGNVVIAGAKKKSKILCEGLEPAMSRRYPASSQYQNVHAMRSWPLPESQLKRRLS